MKSVHEQKGLVMKTMDVPRYILELRDEIKALRAEVELLKPNKPKCGKCDGYQIIALGGEIYNCECQE